MANQVMKASVCRDPKMEAYFNEVRKLESKFDGMEMCYIPQRDNEEDGGRTRIGSTQEGLSDRAFLDIITKPSIRLKVAHEERPEETT